MYRKKIKSIMPVVLRTRSALLLVLVLLAGCSFGPKQLEDGWLAYNDAVRRSSDQELLLNIVRVRYLDTIEFLAVNSISAQLSFSVSVGGQAGRVESEPTSFGLGEVAWSNRPTFTFTPQRGVEFAKTVISPAPLPILLDLASADWHIDVLFRLLVQNVNGLMNLSGLVTEEFIEVTNLLADLQHRGDLYFGAIERRGVLSDPIPVTQVSGSDLVEAAKAGYRFERDPSGDELVLTEIQKELNLRIPLDAAERARIFKLLRLRTLDTPYVMIEAGTQTEIEAEDTDHITVDTRSVLDTIAYLAGGVKVPKEHIDRGWVEAGWPMPEMRSLGLPGFFQVNYSDDRPESALAVRYRGQWFYLADNDAASKTTFLIFAAILRLALSSGEGQAPILTLPVGGR